MDSFQAHFQNVTLFLGLGTSHTPVPGHSPRAKCFRNDGHKVSDSSKRSAELLSEYTIEH